MVLLVFIGELISGSTTFMTLLEVLQKAGKLGKADVERYQALPDTAAIEAALLADHKVTSVELADAWGEVLKLPVVDVAAITIAWSVFAQLPLDQILALHALPYDATARVLKLAVAEPSWLSSRSGALSQSGLQERQLAVTTRESFAQVVKWASVPPVSIADIAIAQAIINRFPRTVAEQHRTVAYAVEGRTIKLATDEPLNPQLWELIAFIEDKNNMTVELGRVPQAELETALASYGAPAMTVPLVPVPVVEPIRSIHPSGGGGVSPAASATIPRGSLTIDRVEKVGAVPKEIQGRADRREHPAFLHLGGEDPDPHPRGVPKRGGGAGQVVTKATSENDLGSLLPSPVKTPEELTAVLHEGFIPKIVAAMVSFGIENRASDVHLEILKEQLRIRFRIDGILHDIASAPPTLHPPMVSRIKILSKMKIDETRVPQDGRFDVVLGDKEVDLRISTLPTVYGEKVVMRLLDKAGGIKDITRLGIEGRGLRLLQENIVKPNGIILVTGPTGSGKSTTLYAVLNKVSTELVNIITLEDPVEYELSGVNQVQVKPKIGFSFAEGLRSVLRQDPNIIMVGEVRDAETASLATHAALTGHLVLTTLHTNDAAGALPRLINMGIEPFLITSAMNLIVGQRLVRKLCEHCRKPTTLPAEVLESVNKELAAIPESNTEDRARVKEQTFFESVGCDQCSNGYSGRLGIYEVMNMTDAIEAATVAKKPASEMLQIAQKEGMITMRQDGFIKAAQGLTTVDEVLRETGKD